MPRRWPGRSRRKWRARCLKTSLTPEAQKAEAQRFYREACYWWHYGNEARGLQAAAASALDPDNELLAMTLLKGLGMQAVTLAAEDARFYKITADSERIRQSLGVMNRATDLMVAMAIASESQRRRFAGWPVLVRFRDQRRHLFIDDDKNIVRRASAGHPAGAAGVAAKVAGLCPGAHRAARPRGGQGSRIVQYLFVQALDSGLGGVDPLLAGFASMDGGGD